MLPGTGAIVADVELADVDPDDPDVALVETPGLIFASTKANIAVAATDTATTLRCNLLDFTSAISPLDIPLKLALAIKNPPGYPLNRRFKSILTKQSSNIPT